MAAISTTTRRWPPARLGCWNSSTASRPLALNAYAHELGRRADLQAVREDSAQVTEQARVLYRKGKIGYLEALDAERNLAISEAALAASEAQLADDQVGLFLALGGGW